MSVEINVGYNKGVGGIDITISHHIDFSDTACVINKNYQVAENEPLSELSTSFADAFRATPICQDSPDDGGDNQFYALVFKNQFPIRLKEIVHQLNNPIPGYLGPVDSGVTQLSEEDDFRFAVVLPYPRGRKLADIIQNKIRLEKKFILTNIIGEVLKILEKFHNYGYSYGAVNPENIYLDQDQNIVLAECISTPCGYRQQPFFETIERSQAIKIGKSSSDIKADYYSLGLLLYALLSGKTFANIKPFELTRAKLASSTYKFISDVYPMEGELADLIKGLTIDDPNLRWGKTEIESVISGRVLSTHALVDTAFLNRAIVFNGKDIYSRRMLAHELATNWDIAKDFIELDKIRKWLETSPNGKLSLDTLDGALDSITIRQSQPKLISTLDEKLIKFIIALDPDGPFRYKNMSFFKEAIGTVLAYSIALSQNENLQIIANLLYLYSFFIYEIVAKIRNVPQYANYTDALRSASESMKNAEIAFGIERVLYELNPFYICQFPILKKYYCINLEQALNILEESALEFDDMFSKKTIISFICSKLEVAEMSKIEKLNRFPRIQKSKVVAVLQILALAQKKAKINRLTRISNIMEDALINLLDTHLNSSRIKKQLYSNLDVIAESGDLHQILNVVGNNDFLATDESGYRQALKRGGEISRDLYEFNDIQLQIKEIKRVGLVYAVNFGYILCVIAIILVLMK